MQDYSLIIQLRDQLNALLASAISAEQLPSRQMELNLSAPIIELPELVALCVTLSNEHDLRAQVVDVIHKMGYKRIQQVPPSLYDEVKSKLEALLPDGR